MIGNLANCTDQQREERNKHYTHLINSSGCKTELDHHAEFIRTLGSKAEKLKPIIWLKSQSKKTAEDWLRDNDLPHRKESAMCKWRVPKICVDIIHQCLLIHGHYGYSQDFPIEQRLRDVLGWEIGDGTAQIQKLIIAREVIGREFVA